MTRDAGPMRIGGNDLKEIWRGWEGEETMQRP